MGSKLHKNGNIAPGVVKGSSVETEDKNTSSDKSVQDSSLIRKKHGTDALRRMKSAISGEFPALKRNGSESNATTATEIKEEAGAGSKDIGPK